MEDITMEKISIVYSILKNTTTDILTTFYQYFWFSLIIAVLVMFAYMYCFDEERLERGLKPAFRMWGRRFVSSSHFRRMFFLAFYTGMVLFRTLINRNLWFNPLQNIMGGWPLWKTAADGSIHITTDSLENVLMLLPLICLLYMTERDRILKKMNVFYVCWKSAWISFVISISIESLQLILRLGTFQISDLCYNTLGGMAGGLIYWLVWKIKRIVKK